MMGEYLEQTAHKVQEIVPQIQGLLEVIVVRLRQVMEAYRDRTGERMTYERLAERTGLSKSTLESLASRKQYNASLDTIERVCRALHCSPADLLDWETKES